MVRVTILRAVPDCECKMMEQVHSEIFDWPSDRDTILKNLAGMVDVEAIPEVTFEDYFSGKIKVYAEALIDLNPVKNEKLGDYPVGTVGPL